MMSQPTRMATGGSITTGGSNFTGGPSNNVGPNNTAHLNNSSRREETVNLAAIGLPILMANVLFVFARIAELVAITTGVVVPFYVLGVHGLALMQALVAGGMRRVMQSSVTWILLGLCFWIGIGLPFSYYRSGSLSTFTTGWLISFTGYFICAGSLQGLLAIRRVAQVLAFSSVVMLVFSFTLGKMAEGRFSFTAGSLANANDFAALLLLGFPFLALPVLRGGNAFKQILSAGLVLAVLVVALRTGSRSGMLTIAVVMLVLFAGLGAASKARFAMAFALLTLIGSAFIGEDTLNRLKSIGGSETEMTMDQMSEAEASSTMRSALFWKAMEMAVENPIFGVGLDAFQAMEYKEAKESGRRGTWLSPHNSFAQMASETGMITLVLLLAFVILGLIRINRSRKMFFQMEGRSDRYFLCLAFQGALTGMAFNFNFSNNAYLPFIYMMVGMCEGVYIYTQVVTQNQNGSTQSVQGPSADALSLVAGGPRFGGGLGNRQVLGTGSVRFRQPLGSGDSTKQEVGQSLAGIAENAERAGEGEIPTKPKYEPVRRLPRSVTR